MPGSSLTLAPVTSVPYVCNVDYLHCGPLVRGFGVARMATRTVRRQRRCRLRRVRHTNAMLGLPNG
eukprot:5473312-Lingulodinium_polyedra.AAC.1